MKKWYLKLIVLLLGITFLFIGKNVYAFDNDQTLNVNAVNGVISVSTLGQPFQTPANWTSYTQNYVYGIRTPYGTYNSYVRALQGSVTSAYEPNKNYTIEIAIKHGYQLYSGDTPNGQGKIYNPYCDLQVSQGAVSNVSCQIEQNTYIYDNIYYDRLSFNFTTSNISYSNVVYTWQFGLLNQTDYVYINLRTTGDENVNNWISWDNVYMGYDNESTNTDVGGIISSLDRNNSTQQQGNTILRQIREKLSDFKDSFDNKMDSLISKVQSILENMGQGISGIVSNILQFISNDVLGLDDIDDTLQDFVDSFEGNEVMGDIHDFLYSPVGLLNNLYDPTPGSRCADMSTTIFNKTIIIPSGCFFWDRSDVSNFKHFWNWLFGGFLIFSLGFKYFKVLHNAFDPTKDDLGGLNV